MQKLRVIYFGIAIFSGFFGCNKSIEKPANTSQYSNPVSQLSLADPSVIKADNGIFYVYASGHNGVVVKSNDLVSWEPVGDIFTEEGRPSFLENGDIWAPDINKINGQYVLYYSLSKWGELYNNGVGISISNSPEGPFTDKGKLFISTEIGVTNSIDPVYITDKGRNFLFWGSFNGIYGIELTSDGLSILPNAEKRKIAGPAYEGSYILQHNDYYYYFGSMLTCCEGSKSLYTTIVARSKSLFGPYENKEGGHLLNNFHELLILGNKRFAGTGHNSEILQDSNGHYWILYHAYERNNPNYRKLMLDEIQWKDGWPYVQNNTSSFNWTKPIF